MTSGTFRPTVTSLLFVIAANSHVFALNSQYVNCSLVWMHIGTM